MARKTRLTAVELQKQDQDRRATRKRGIVMRYARGNVRLQAGRYLTQDELDEKRERVLRLAVTD